ncbi:MAG: sugar phosphate nucleotidyltransferase [Patescibacteria group bacterium]
MQLVILAAGKGSRMKEFTEVRPKPMLIVGGKHLLERKIETLPKEIDEVVLVVGYLKEHIISYFGNFFADKKITYVVCEPLGTGYALWQARHLLGSDFVVMMGDDMYGTEDVVEVIKHPWAMSTFETPGFATAADIETDENGYLRKADFDYEGKKEKIMLDTGLYKLKKEIFDADLVQLKNGEFGLPHTIFAHVKNTNTPLYVNKARHWLKMNSPEDLNRAEEHYMKGN